MKTPCYIESVNCCPNTSSCSMILRSACSHGHSHKSITSNEVRIQSSEKKRTSVRKSSDKVSEVCDTKSTLQLDSLLESSIKQFALKSTATFSILKEKLYNHLDFSESQKNEVLEKSDKTLESVTEHHVIKTSTPISSLYINENFITTKDLIGNAYSCESFDNSITTMSGRRRLQRSALRALSGSDTDDEDPYLQNKVRSQRSATTNTVSHINSAERISAESSTNLYSRSSNHVNSKDLFSPAIISTGITDTSSSYNGNSVLNQRSLSNSSQIDISTVQDSMFNKLRWIIWRHIYLMIIRSVNFDVWLLSRLRGSYKAVLLLLLPLLVYLFYSTIVPKDGVIDRPFDLISSSVSSFTSALYSLHSRVFVQSEDLLNVDAGEEEVDAPCPNIYFVLPSFSGISGYFSSFFIKTDESIVNQKTISPSSPDPSSESVGEEQFRSLALQMSEEKLNNLVKTIQVSHVKDMHAVKMQFAADTAQLQKEISDLRQQFKSLSVTFQQFQSDAKILEKSSAKNIESLSSEFNMNINSFNVKMKDFEKKLVSFSTLKQSCDQNLDPAVFIASIEKHLVAAFRSVVDGDKSSSYHFFSEWLNSKFTDPKVISSEINIVLERLKKEQSAEKQDKSNLKMIEGVVQHYFDSLIANTSFSSHGGGSSGRSLSTETVKRIVKEAILLYDADKTGLVDYALESAGGSVLSIRCSESYTDKKGKFSLLGFPLWSDQNSPRTAIQPDVQPGQCWSFKGSQGFLVIQLSYTVHPTGFTLEHIPVSLSPTGSIDSAPKDFSVWGLESETDNEGSLLGKYSYEDNGEPLQYFAVQNLNTEPFAFVELKILSNHGNIEYTCLYRFRVHGTRVK